MSLVQWVRAAALVAALVLGAPAFGNSKAEVATAVNSGQLAAQVIAQTKHAWAGYVQYAWGHDALKPLSKSAHDWYAHSLLMTPVDALDTLILMGLTEEADAARELIKKQLSFDQDFEVKNFEVTIRLLGGLLSGYQLTGDQRLLQLATDLGNRLLPAFESKTGMPYMYVNLRTGKVSGVESNPAETGTLLLEFGTLSKLSGDPRYYDKAKRALVATFEHRSKIGLVGDGINVETGEWVSRASHLSGGIDSYYEYLWKCWKLFDDRDCLQMWKASIKPVHEYLADEVHGALWYGYADMHTGKRSEAHFGALDAFFPGLLALSGDQKRAARLQESAFRMWQLHGIEPEVLDYRSMKVVHPGYPLRPEIVESAFYLHYYTHDPRWQQMGAQMFADFVKYCRTEAGFAALSDVTRKSQKDSMESFLFAETFKYYYLLFAPVGTIDLDEVVFNTEAHPLRATWK